jgi:hypothetical protein
MQNWRNRESRKTVRLSVRVRTDDGWIDATVRNVSSRGMMLHSLQPLRRNQFVEIARGRHRVVGRIVWSDATACGLQSQDKVDIQGLLSQPADAAALGSAERRMHVRSRPPQPLPPVGERAAASRAMGRAFEFAFVVTAVSSVAAIAAISMQEALAAPLTQVELAMSGQGSAKAPG